MRLETGRKAFSSAALVVALLFTGAARAEEPKVDVLTEVVLASNEGSTVDPPKLMKLKDELAKAGAKFSSLKRLSEKRITVQKNKPVEVSLPDGRSATLKLVDIKDGSASINVTVPQKGKAQPFTTTYQAGRSSLTVPAGDFQNGKLVLILSPPEGAQPRNALGLVKRRDLVPLKRAPLPAPAASPSPASVEAKATPKP